MLNYKLRAMIDAFGLLQTFILQRLMLPNYGGRESIGTV